MKTLDKKLDQSIHGSKTPVITAKDLPKALFNAFEGRVPQKIAGYIRAFLIDSARIHQTEMISIPSISEISMHLFCHEFDVLEAMKSLERQGYKYYMQDLYTPLLITRIPACHTQDSGLNLQAVATQISKIFGQTDEKQFSQA